MLHKTLSQLNDSSATTEIAKYFSIHYAKRVKEWAACYRKSANINTNMYIESFHRILKYVYLKGRVIDNLIYILMRLSRDKAFERLCKLEKGKVSGRLATIRKRHLASTKLPLHLVEQKEDSQWCVTSGDHSQEYTILLENSGCPTNCQLLCKECAVCIHMFSCTWMDYVINHTICKHMHPPRRYQ